MPIQPDVSLRALSRTDLPDLELAREVARLVRDLGGRALLVGGCVRDALLGRDCHDFDLEIHGIAADALEKALAARWPLDKVGASFGVLKLKHAAIDISLPRLENRLGAGHRDFAVATDPFLSPSDAADRRDFTVNAVMADPLTLETIDPKGGIDDLRRGVLRHVSPKFAEDPLRVLRGMQFLSRFPFLEAAPELIEICAGMTQDALPQERLAGEWEKLLLSGIVPSRGLRFLRACGWIRFYPALATLPGCPQDPIFHPEGDVWEHSLLALDASVALRGSNADDNLARALAALCHDLGKPLVTARGADDGRWHAYGHEVESVPLARDFVLNLWNREKLASLVCRLVEAHMRPVSLGLSRAGGRAYRRLAVQVQRLDLLADVVECDIRATTPPGGNPDKQESLSFVRAFREKCASLAIDKAPPKPIVLGRDLIARGYAPGPEFGSILKACYEAQLSGEIRDPESGAVFLENFLRSGAVAATSASSAAQG